VLHLEKTLNQTTRKLFSLIQATEGFSDLDVDVIEAKALDIGFPLRTSREGTGAVILLPRACRHLADSQAWLELLPDAADSG
jgi:hypothetical protein